MSLFLLLRLIWVLHNEFIFGIEVEGFYIMSLFLVLRLIWVLHNELILVIEVDKGFT